MHAQHGKNYRFFGAPVGIIFTIERKMNTGSWLDFGCFLQSFMVAARGRNLDTCAQAAFNRFHPVIREIVGIPEGEIVMWVLKRSGTAVTEATSCADLKSKIDS
jgi:nitroreductase